MTTSETWYTYILLCSDNTLYTGCTNDLKKRLERHNQGKGSKYTRIRLPVQLVYSEQAANKSSAAIREYAIKQLPRKSKLALIEHAQK